MATKILSKNNYKSVPEKSLEKSVNFEFYAPFASEVSLAGEFNSWDSSKNTLTKDTNGKWHASIRLKPGRYEYRLLVDGNWENDPKSTEYVPNAYGTWNCVIEVR